MAKQGFVYIMANDRPTLYTGVTSNLKRRVYEHKIGFVPGFTARYNLHKLVYFESLSEIEQAIIREKQIKDMSRKDKLQMIRELNSKFKDLYSGI
jgi:putative endonuclease